MFVLVQREPLQQAQRLGLLPEELATIEVFQNNTPSVVNITNVQARRVYNSMDVLKVPTGSGSGFIWDKEGHVVTNFHVIKVSSLDRPVYSL